MPSTPPPSQQESPQTTPPAASSRYLEHTRNFCQFRVGTRQVVDVVLHRRPEDSTTVERSDVMELLETSILPRLFSESMEEQHARDTKQAQPPAELGLGGIPLLQKQTKQLAANNNKKRKKMTKKERAERLQQHKDAERKERKNQKEVYYATSDTLRIAYQLLETSEKRSSGGSATLVRDGTTGWTALTPVDTARRRKLVLWCYPIDVELPVDHGFLRPTMIPMASLFRQPKDSTLEEEPITVDSDDDPKEKNPSPKKKKRRKKK